MTTTTHLNHVYLRAHYYDIVFNRDIRPHIHFCQDLYQHTTGHPLQSALDIACGPGYHARAFAEAGIPAYGLDLSHEMLNFARSQSAGLPVEFVEADMCDFHLPTPVDLAITVFDGIDLLTSEESAIAHFNAVAANLNPGGLYIIEQTHPRRSGPYDMGGVYRWDGERDGVYVEFLWGLNDARPDIVTGVAEIHMEMRVNDHGQEFVYHDHSYERTMCLAEMRLVAERLAGGFQTVAYFGEFDLGQPLDWSDNSERMITVFQKRS